ncbi:MAG: hypothetical protein V4490_02320 [Pseudomonadota bacterium]
MSKQSEKKGLLQRLLDFIESPHSRYREEFDKKASTPARIALNIIETIPLTFYYVFGFLDSPFKWLESTSKTPMKNIVKKQHTSSWELSQDGDATLFSLAALRVLNFAVRSPALFVKYLSKLPVTATDWAANKAIDFVRPRAITPLPQKIKAPHPTSPAQEKTTKASQNKPGPTARFLENHTPQRPLTWGPGLPMYMANATLPLKQAADKKRIEQQAIQDTLRQRRSTL